MPAGYELVIVNRAATIPPGEFLVLDAYCPDDKVLVGGGAWTQDVPKGSATNYVLKSSYPVFDGTAQAYKWQAVFTNVSEDVHPQVVQFEARAICVPKVATLGA
jgi:hypothetical protein